MYQDSTLSSSPRALISVALNRRLDRFGALASGACAVHCAMLPFVAASLPLVGLGVLASEAFELSFIALALALAAVSLAAGWLRHRSLKPAAWLGLGAALFAFGTLGPLHHHEFWHAALLVAGGISLVTAHWLNLRRLRCAASI